MIKQSLNILLASILISLPAYADSQIEINYEEFTLDNGLRIIVHEDNKAPIVAINLWYHVGSKEAKIIMMNISNRLNELVQLI